MTKSRKGTIASLISKRDTTIRTCFDTVSTFLTVLHMCYSRLFIYLLVDTVPTFFDACPTAVAALILNNSWNFDSPIVFIQAEVSR